MTIAAQNVKIHGFHILSMGPTCLWHSVLLGYFMLACLLGETTDPPLPSVFSAQQLPQKLTDFFTNEPVLTPEA